LNKTNNNNKLIFKFEFEGGIEEKEREFGLVFFFLSLRRGQAFPPATNIEYNRKYEST
jgi:hypothetical protein